MPELGRIWADAGSISPEPAQLWHLYREGILGLSVDKEFGENLIKETLFFMSKWAWFILDKRNTSWLRDKVRQNSQGMSRLATPEGVIYSMWKCIDEMILSTLHT